MAKKEPEQYLITPDNFVHPRQHHLWQRLQNPAIPLGADELIREAIAEYQAAFRSPVVASDGSRISSEVTISLPTDGPSLLLAGKIHILTVQFGEIPQGPVETFTHLTTILDPGNLGGAEVYPDWLRYPGIDVNGSSAPVRFMVRIPEWLRGRNSELGVQVFNGGNLTVARTLAFSLA